MNIFSMTDGQTDGRMDDGLMDGTTKSGEGHYDHFWLKIIQTGAILGHFLLLPVSPKALPRGVRGGRSPRETSFQYYFSFNSMLQDQTD